MTQRHVADAVIAGYEVSLRLGEALGTGHAAGFHATATAGAVGAAASAAVALGLEGQSLHDALGIGATQSAGLWQLVDDGAHEAKSLHPAFAVRNGLAAAYAAAPSAGPAPATASPAPGPLPVAAPPAPADAASVAPTEAAAAAPAEHAEVALDQETFERVLAELLEQGTDRRVAEGRARRAAMVAARAKAEDGS